MIKSNLSLNQRLIGTTVAAFVIIIGLLTTNEYQTLKKESVAFQRERAVSLSDNIKNGIAPLMLQGKCAELTQLLKTMAHSKSIDLLHIFNPGNGVIIASSNDLDVGKRLKETDNNLYLKHNDGIPFLSSENKAQHFVRFLPIENIATCHKCHSTDKSVLGVIELKISIARVLSFVNSILIKNVVFSLLSILLFSLVFSYIVIMLIHEPLDEIIETIKYVEEGNLEKQVTVKRNDIIGKLSEKFNTMIKKIGEARKEVEKYHREQMRRASQMATVGEIASGIAHEIKNPLACISAALQVVDGDMEEKNEHKSVIREVMNQVKRLDVSVKRILEFAKPVRTQKTSIAIDEVLTETLSFISQFANKKSIQINVVGGKGIKKVYADAKAIKQVFLNICLNAIDAMQEKGILTIMTAMINMEDPGVKKEYVEIRIRDTGTGIEEKNLAGIFDPFFTTKESGTGLGLSISVQIVEEHGGFIDVESVPGQGATFMIYIPAINEG